MREKIETLVKIYKKMLEKEKSIMAETKGKPKMFNKWMEAVNGCSCYTVFIRDLEELLKEDAELDEKERKEST